MQGLKILKTRSCWHSDDFGDREAPLERLGHCGPLVQHSFAAAALFQSVVIAPVDTRNLNSMFIR